MTKIQKRLVLLTNRKDYEHFNNRIALGEEVGREGEGKTEK